MPALLIADQEYFDAKFVEAAAFLRAATLRKELFNLLCKQKNGEVLTPYQTDRVSWLRRCPACHEPAFLDLLDRNSLTFCWED